MKIENNIVVVDTGQNIVGVLTVNDEVYKPFYGEDKNIGAKQVLNAKEIITFNGNVRDIPDLIKFGNFTDEETLLLKSKHIDMREVCWGEEIWGSNLKNTYDLHFNDMPFFPDTYIDGNHQDTYLALKLWERWKEGTLKTPHHQ